MRKNRSEMLKDFIKQVVDILLITTNSNKNFINMNNMKLERKVSLPPLKVLWVVKTYEKGKSLQDSIFQILKDCQINRVFNVKKAISEK